ncbi:hypothetical protein [Paenibacillus sp. MY03]|uniref:hypothetical protein n=1 Tax=Paenibacillus sp. MY03 TaxID=302980 RepID=UPI001180A70B|nr:hypothetical protein [Paenibacillus sp. MY03]
MGFLTGLAGSKSVLRVTLDPSWALSLTLPRPSWLYGAGWHHDSITLTLHFIIVPKAIRAGRGSQKLCKRVPGSKNGLAAQGYFRARALLLPFFKAHILYTAADPSHGSISEPWLARVAKFF